MQQQNQAPLIVRVKRHRSDEPANTICVVDDSSGPKRKSMKSLTLGGDDDDDEHGDNNGRSTVEGTHLIFSRVNTLKSSVDTNFAANAQMWAASSSNSRSDVAGSNSSIIIAGSKRKVNISRSGEDSYVIVEATQVRSNQQHNHHHYPATTTVAAAAAAAVNLVDCSSSGSSSSSSSELLAHKKGRTATSASASASPAPVRILSPSLRALDAGIKLAMASGDFSGISDALLRGADPNYQQKVSDGGYTALMCTAAHGNVRVAKRLLLRGVDASLLNNNGETALDILLRAQRNANSHAASARLSPTATGAVRVATIRPTEFIELRLLFQEHLLKSYRRSAAGGFYEEREDGGKGADEDDDLFTSDKQRLAASAAKMGARSSSSAKSRRQAGCGKTDATASIAHTRGNADASGIEAHDGAMHEEQEQEEEDHDESEGGDYVFDIFQYYPSSLSSGSASSALGHHSVYSEPSHSIASASSLVKLQGLKLLDNGNVDVESMLTFAYDSDWSDLAEDEDPDSNDERNECNDYPDEEAYEEDEETNEWGRAAAARAGGGRGDYEDDDFDRAAPGSGARVDYTAGELEYGPEDYYGLNEEPTTTAGKAAAASAARRGDRVRFQDQQEYKPRLMGTVGTTGSDDENERGDADGEDDENDDSDSSSVDDVIASGRRRTAEQDRILAQLLREQQQQQQQARRSAKTMPLPEGVDLRTSSNSNSSRRGREGGRAAVGSGAFDIADDEEGDVEADADAVFDAQYGAHMPRFENTLGVGRVMRPFVVGGGGPAGGVGGYDSQSLQELWGEEQQPPQDQQGGFCDVDYDGGEGHAVRLEQMRQRTGMHFASNTREFDSLTGLAKYGADLSDDEKDPVRAGFLREEPLDLSAYANSYSSNSTAGGGGGSDLGLVHTAGDGAPYDAAALAAQLLMTENGGVNVGRIMGTATGIVVTPLENGMHPDGSSGELYSNRRRVKKVKNTRGCSGTAGVMPPKDTIAFDPELDLDLS